MNDQDQGLRPGDAVLLAALRGAVARSAVPAEVAVAARAAIAGRVIEGELAELLADSARDVAVAGTRGASDVRRLTFRSPGLVVELDLTREGGRAVGQLAPAGPAAVRAEQPAHAAAPVAADATGGFVLTGLGPGPLRLHVEPAGGASLATAWVVI